jgi:predicted DsbA family dithiol-disulfide isomerase
MRSTGKEAMLIDVYTDVVCPWCYIGEKRLAKALAERPDLEVEVRWRPFQLEPGIPEGGLPWAEFSQRKFGGESGAKAAFFRVAAAGERDGIRFDFGRVASAPNTVDAHRLILFARNHRLQQELSDALFGAYFTEGKDLNDHEELVHVASSVGLDATEVREYLAGEEGAYEVLSSQEEAWRLGITGVPFYVFEGRYAIYGAQPVEVFGEALDMVRAGTAG